MKEIIEAAQTLDGLGVVGFMAIALILSVWAIRFLYKEKERCAADRLENTIAIGHLQGDVNTLNTKVEFQDRALSDAKEQIAEAKEDMREMHVKALEMVAGGK